MSNGCALSADGRIGLSASRDWTLAVWNIGHRKTIQRLLPRHKTEWRQVGGNSLQFVTDGHRSEVNGCALSADGRRGLSASHDKTLIVWDVARGKFQQHIRGHTGSVKGCALSADGWTGLSFSYDGTLIVWNLESGARREYLRGHDGAVSGCALNADGRIGISASEDGTLIVWDLDGQRQRHRLRGHEGPLNSCAISADGSIGLSSSDDGTLIVWDLESGTAYNRFATSTIPTALALTQEGLLALAGDRAGNVTCFEVVR